VTEGPDRSPGPGAGPGGVPTAIALTPILSARYRARDLEVIRAAAPGSRLVTIPDAGHMAPLENPAPTDAAILGFLATLGG